MELTKKQKTFLLNYFFKNKDYPGAENIALKLLSSGECIVAGDASIWQGGIGNFIKIKPAENAIGCSLYTFDIKEFLSCDWYKNIMNEYLGQLSCKITDLSLEFKEINQLQS